MDKVLEPEMPPSIHLCTRCALGVDQFHGAGHYAAAEEASSASPVSASTRCGGPMATPSAPSWPPLPTPHGSPGLIADESNVVPLYPVSRLHRNHETAEDACFFVTHPRGRFDRPTVNRFLSRRLLHR